MSWLYFDCFSGISGDMTLGALIDVGLPIDVLRDGLQQLPLQGYEIQLSRRMVGVLDAAKIDVVLHDHSHTHDHDHDHTHSHSHAHSHDHDHDHTHSHSHAHSHAHDHTHHHTHEHHHDHEHHHSHNHRSYRDIKQMITSSGVSEGVKSRALAMFARLAIAEGAAHGMPPDDVSFHEVGAIDSIVDMVGAAIGLEYLGVTRVFCSPLPLGRGFVNCQHGRIPIPAPATLNILQGIPVIGTSLPFELVTPTGAAIVAASTDCFGEIPSFVLEKVGYGAGTRQLPDRPNMLRVLLGRPHQTTDASADCLQLETNLDDLTPELLAYVVEQLLGAGARDVWLTPIVMKKGRLAHKLSILCLPAQRPTMESIVFRESSSLGVRCFPVSRQVLERTIEEIETPFGLVGIKTGREERGGPLRTFAPEYEDCRRLAQQHQVPLKEVYAAATKAWQQRHQ